MWAVRENVSRTRIADAPIRTTLEQSTTTNPYRAADEAIASLNDATFWPSTWDGGRYTGLSIRLRVAHGSARRVGGRPLNRLVVRCRGGRDVAVVYQPTVRGNCVRRRADGGRGSAGLPNGLALHVE